MGVLDAWIWAREQRNADGVRPGQLESTRWTEGYERIAEIAAAMPGTRLDYMADREGDLMALMRRARDLGLATDKIEALACWTHAATNPDLTLLFDITHRLAKSRISGARPLDRIEREAEEFHDRVRARYQELASREPARFRVIDASQSPEIIDVLLHNIISTI